MNSRVDSTPWVAQQADIALHRSDLEERKALGELFEQYAMPAIALVLGTGGGGAGAAPRLKQALPATDLNMVQQLCELLALHLRDSGRVRDPQARGRAPSSRGAARLGNFAAWLSSSLREVGMLGASLVLLSPGDLL